MTPLIRLIPLLVLLCQTGLHLAAADPSSITGRNWMSALPDDWKLGRFTIPGTHETCARHESFPDTAICQTLTLRQQLDAGVRFLDIRCRHIKNSFAIHHGMEFQKLYFDNVLQEVQLFLRDNPSETILMSVKKEHTDSGNTRSFVDTFNDYLSRFPGLFDLRATVPTLGRKGDPDSVRGKILLVRRFGATAPFGLDADAWPYSPLQPFNNGTFRVQDWCWLPDSSEATFNTKFGQFLLLRREAMTSTDDQVVYLNFSSAFDKNWMGIPKSLWAVSKYMNPRIQRLMTDPTSEGYATRGRGGVINMDFVTAPLVESVWRTAVEMASKKTASRSVQTAGQGSVDYEMSPRFAPSPRDPGFASLPNTASYAQPTDFEVRVFPTAPLAEPVQYTWTLTPTSGPTLSATGVRPLLRLTAGPWEARYMATRDGVVVDQGSARIEVRDLLIVALGDGQASGEGNPELDRVYTVQGDPDMTPERFDSVDLRRLSFDEFPSAAQILTSRNAIWARGGDAEATLQNRLAHRSMISGPALYARNVELNDPHTSVTFISVAQSGATLSSMLETAGNPRNLSVEDDTTPLPVQLTHLKALIGNRPIDQALLSTGADDAGISALLGTFLVDAELSDLLDIRGRERGISLATVDTIADEVLAEIRSRPEDNAVLTNPSHTGILDLFEAATSSLPGRLSQLASALRASFVVGRVAILEQPDPTRTRVLGTDGRLTPWWGPLFDDVLPGKAVSATEALVASRLLIAPLNRMLKESATTHGWSWVSGINDVFAGHGYAVADHDRWIRTGRGSLLEQGSSPTWGTRVLPVTSSGMGYPKGPGVVVIARRIGLALGGPGAEDNRNVAISHRGSLLPSGNPVPIDLGRSPTEDEFVITNTGEAPLSLEYASVTGDFRVTRYLNPTIPPGESSTLRVASLAQDLGSRDGEVRIVFQNPGMPAFTTRISEINLLQIDPHRWMGSLPDRWTLGQFSIPATHASAARKESVPGTTRHQAWSLREQLDAGIRGLDIGCRLKDGVLRVFEGGTDQETHLGAVIDEAIGFLKANPSESLLAVVREEPGSMGNFGEALDREVARNPEFWHVGTELPVLGKTGTTQAARGRLVLVRRFAPAGKASGIDASHWSTGFPGTFRSGPFRIGDAPDVESLDQGDDTKKWARVQGALNQARFDQELTSLTFANGRVVPPGEPGQVPAVAREINALLETFVSVLPTSDLGVVFMDFPTTNLVRSIFQTGYGFQERIRSQQVKDPSAWRETFDSDSDRLDDSWEIWWFGSLDRTGRDDADLDGQDNLSEFYAGTSPTDAASRLGVTLFGTGSAGPTLSWPVVEGVSYTIQSTESLSTGTWSNRASGLTNIPYEETDPGSTPTRYYRVVVEGDPLKGVSSLISPP